MKQLLKELKEFIGRLINSEKPTSSKRVMALWAAIILCTYAVVRFVNSENIIEFLYPTYGFILGLVGVSAYQDIMKYKK